MPVIHVCIPLLGYISRARSSGLSCCRFGGHEVGRRCRLVFSPHHLLATAKPTDQRGCPADALHMAICRRNPTTALCSVPSRAPQFNRIDWPNVLRHCNLASPSEVDRREHVVAEVILHPRCLQNAAFLRSPVRSSEISATMLIVCLAPRKANA